jgi:hypothetical protein
MRALLSVPMPIDTPLIMALVSWLKRQLTTMEVHRLG